MRSARPEDAAALATLWRAAGLHFRAGYVGVELQSALARNPDLVIVADDPPAGRGEESAGGLAGSVFGTFDGRRGWLNRLATSAARCGEGIATALVCELERRLLAKGCVKINLLVEQENADVISFYGRLGFQPRSMIFMDKWIVGPPNHWARRDHNVPPDPAGRDQDSGPQPSPSAQLLTPAPVSPPAPAAQSWTDIEPVLYGESYVFVSAPEPPPNVQSFAAIQEDEGLTLVLTQDQADRGALAYEYVAARITLAIGSSLSAVGLTARVSRVLADAGISCNVIAGLRHDHLFVDWDRGADAAALLRRL